MSSLPFFVGNGRNLGSAHAATARSFSEFVDRYLNIAVPLPVTRDQFASMPKHERDLVKRTNFAVPCVFRTSPSRRVYEQALHCNLIFIDLDVEPDGHCPAAPFVNSPESLIHALHPFSCAAYQTASSTSSEPRIRIVVEAKEIPVSQYAKAVATVFAMLGVAHITRESQVAVQPMFLPVIFKGDDPSTQHPLIIYKHDGEVFSVKDIAEVLPTHEGKPRPLGAAIGLEAMDFLRPPMPEITIDIARDALSALDPDMPYQSWLEVAAALRHQFSHTQPEEAYQLFLEWSSKGNKFAGPQDTEAKWKSLRPTPAGRAPITFRSLLRQAVTAGWSCAEVKELCFRGLMRWMGAEARSSSSLLAEGLGRIAATPLLSQAEEDALLHQMVIEARTRFGLRVNTTALRRDLRGIKEEMRKQRDKKSTESHPAWTSGMVYIAKTNQICRHSTGETLIPEAVNAMFGKFLLPTESQLKEAQMPCTTANLARPFVAPFTYLVNKVKIPSVYDTTYDPSCPDDLFTMQGGSVMLNTYVRDHPSPDAATGMLAGNAFRRHLENIIAEPEYVRIILDFFAFLVQNPGRKIRWMILLQGAQGCGKSFLVDVMRVVLGSRHVKVVDSNVIKSPYNDWIVGAQLLAIEEIRVTGVNRHEIMNALKGVVTNDHVLINQKFRDPRPIQNRANVIALTNFKDAIVVEETDRRNCVIQCSTQTKSQVKALGEEYFDCLYAMLSEYPGGLRWFFENWKISDSFEPDGHAPVTRYMAQLVEDSASEIVTAVKTFIREEDHPLVRRDLVSSKVLLEMLSSREGLSKVTNPHLAKILRELNYINQGRHMINGERHYLWSKIGEYNSRLSPEDEARARCAIPSEQLSLL